MESESKKKKLPFERRKAVAKAWKRERELVSKGYGTRDWTLKEQKELLRKGKVSGYHGHHMKSVDGHNSRAGDVDNIQFLTKKEHLAAHKGCFRNNTNGYYDYKTGETHSFSRYKPSIEPKKLKESFKDKMVNKFYKSAATATIAVSMGTAIKAHDAGFQTVRGYCMYESMRACNFGLKYAEKKCGIPSAMSSSFNSKTLKSLALTYDDQYAKANPDKVIKLGSHSSTAEMVDEEHTRYVGDATTEGFDYSGDLLIAPTDAEALSKTADKAYLDKSTGVESLAKLPKVEGETGVDTSKSKTLNAQRASKPKPVKSGTETASKTLRNQRKSKESSSSSSSLSKKSKGHGH